MKLDKWQWKYKKHQGGRSCAGARGAPAKSLNSDINFRPDHTIFCRELRFVAIYALFGDLWAKKVPFWVKNSVSWARSALLHGIYCIFHWVNFANLRLRAKMTHLTQKIVNTRLTKIFIAIFAPDERQPSSPTLLKSIVHHFSCRAGILLGSLTGHWRPSQSGK